MTLFGFFNANGNISDVTDITVHTTFENYNNPPVNPLDDEAFYQYSAWKVSIFSVDDNGHWHVWITPPTI